MRCICKAEGRILRPVDIMVCLRTINTNTAHRLALCFFFFVFSLSTPASFGNFTWSSLFLFSCVHMFNFERYREKEQRICRRARRKIQMYFWLGIVTLPICLHANFTPFVILFTQLVRLFFLCLFFFSDLWCLFSLASERLASNLFLSCSKQRILTELSDNEIIFARAERKIEFLWKCRAKCKEKC